MKRNLLSLLWAVVAAAMLVGCSPAATPSGQPSTEMTPGTYTATVKGYNGDYEVTVTVSADAILDIVVGEHHESPGVGSAAIEIMTADMLANNTAGVDVVTGATVSSAVFRAAVTDCLKQANAPAARTAAVAAEPTADQTITTDVLVVGAGAAGLSAAITAAQGGADVILIEKQGIIGGSTIVSAGIVYAAMDESDYDTMVDYYMARAEGKASEELLRYYTENSIDTIEFLNDAGVQWMMTIPAGTAPEPRAHFSMGEYGPMFGVSLTDPLARKAESLGVTIMLNTKATALRTDAAGSVVGVEATTKTGNITFEAGAVILATGGFDASEEMKAEYAPWTKEHMPLSNKGNTGEGIRMGMDVGAATVFQGGMIGFTCVNPAWPNSGQNPLVMNAPLIVDADGTFVTLGIDYPITHTQMWKHDVEQGFAIYGAAGADTAQTAIDLGVGYEGDTIEALAAAAGMDAAKLTAAVGEAAAITEGPYYAVVIRPTTIGSMGGLKTNTDAQVLAANDGAPIPGLYAAGEVANGEFYYQEYPASGSSISLAITFGRAAGSHAAAFVGK